MIAKLPLRFVPNFWFLVSFGLYTLIFFLPLPMQVNFKGVQVVDEAIVLASCVLILSAFRKAGWAWKTLALTLTLTIFTLPILRLWGNVESDYNLILGLLPWSDASGYYSDAITLLQGSLFGEFSGRRPLFASLLAVLLNFSNGNIQTSVIVLTIINGLATFLFALEARENFDPLAGAGVVLLVQFYYRQFAGALLTEQLGLPLGLLAFASLMNATRHKKEGSFSVGLFILTLALFARAGAFFVLPAILIVGIFLFKENETYSLKTILILLSALVVGWGANLALGKMVATPDTTPMGNFSYTLYGQAVGGKGWTQVLIDHPEISNIPGSEHTQAVYRLAFDEIRRNPAGLATGFLKAWKDFFVPSMYAGFGFIQPGDKYSSLIIQAILTVFLFVGLFQSWQRRNQGVYFLLIAISAGILISIPFIPPSESTYMRVYAVTVAVPSLIACLGLTTLVEKWTVSFASSPAWIPGTGLILSGAGLTLVFITLAGALLIRATARPDPPLNVTCPNGSIPLQFKLSNGAFISIATNESGLQTYIPTISARDFRQSLRAFPGVYNNFSHLLIETITPPVLLSYTRNLLTGDFLWLIAPPELAKNVGKTIRGCGEATSQDSSVVFIKSIQ